MACPAAVLTVHWEKSLAASRRLSAVPELTYTVAVLLLLDSLTAMPLSCEKEAFSPPPPSPPL